MASSSALGAGSELDRCGPPDQFRDLERKTGPESCGETEKSREGNDLGSGCVGPAPARPNLGKVTALYKLGLLQTDLTNEQTISAPCSPSSDFCSLRSAFRLLDRRASSTRSHSRICWEPDKGGTQALHRNHPRHGREI